MLANITMVAWNRLELTRRAVTSLLAKTRGEYFLNIVDNGSEDGTGEYLQSLEGRANLKVHRLRRNMGVAVAANLGWAATEAPYYIKFDNDVEVLDGGWLTRLLGVMERNTQIGMAGYRLCDWKHRAEPILLPSGDRFIASECCNGGCAAIPARVHERLGFWIEDYGKYGFTDVDYATRAAALGLLVGYVAEADGVLHHGGFEDGQVDEALERAKRETVKSPAQGEPLYVMNRFLFESGLRPLKVERRYLPIAGEDRIRFASNPAYAAIIRVQQDYLSRMTYEADADGKVLVRFSPDKPAE